jgi:uncharacterized protein YndB with AHSA1/START domain
MGSQLTAHASITMDAPAAKVWEALVNPEIIKQYMFGTKVISDWKVGSEIIWKGVWQEKEYEDKGKILELQPEKILKYSHFSPLAGQADVPENYHTVTVELQEGNSGTRISLAQDNNPTEQSREHSEKNWQMMLDTLKKFLEKRKQNINKPNPDVSGLGL